MIRSATALALTALLATAASAAPPPAAAPAPSNSVVAGAAPTTRLGWASLGLYDVRYSAGNGFTYSEADFGVGAGGAVNLAQLTPDVPLAGFANVAIAFATGGLAFPLTAGAAIRYDKLPVQLLGGLGFTIMPNSTGAGTGVGAGILLMGLYPLPQLDPRLSAQAQIQYHLLTNNLSLFEFVVGAGFAL